MRTPWIARAHTAIASCCVAIAVSGIASAAIITPITLALAGVYVGLACASLAAAWIAARIAGWRVASMLVLVWLVAFAWFEGVHSIVALTGLVLAALAVGSCSRTGSRDGIHAIAVGLVVLGAATGWTLMWPVHTGIAWWLVLVLLVAWRRRPVLRLARATVRRWHARVDEAPGAATLAVLALGLASTSTWLPNLQADDLAFHLRLPTELLHDAAYQPDVQRQVWAYAPWLNDTLHGIVATLGGQVTHAPLNLLWLALVGAFAWRLTRALGASVSLGWFGVALATSVPLLVGVATGMHTELPATALTLGLCAMAFSPVRAGTSAGIAWLAGGLLALKGLHVLAALPLLAFALWRMRAHARNAAPHVVVAFAVCASAYVQGWSATANPVFPLMNGVFRSSAALPVDFMDPRWRHGVDWQTPWQLVFETSRFLESGNGALGVAALVLLGGALPMAARREWWVPMAATALLIVIPFALVQYARYALPGVVCFSLVALAASGRVLGARGASVLAAMCLATHLLLLPSGNWLLSTSALARHVIGNGDDAVLRRKFLPAQAALARIPSDGPGSVLSTDPDAPYVAPFGRRGLGVTWYSPILQAAARRANADAQGTEWMLLFAAHDVAWVLVDADKVSEGLDSALRRSDAVVHAAEGQATVWHLPRATGQ